MGISLETPTGEKTTNPIYTSFFCFCTEIAILLPSVVVVIVISDNVPNYLTLSFYKIQ